jgi:hypothetical protein
VAWLLPACSAEATASFLREILAPLYRRAGWPLRRGLTDGGSEFKGPFEETCRALGIRHTRTQPRHAWTHGFVERLQGTILHEPWRIEFRRHDFPSRAAMRRSLDAFLRFDNQRRPHQDTSLPPGCGDPTATWGASDPAPVSQGPGGGPPDLGSLAQMALDMRSACWHEHCGER